jgi:NADP-dependent 3-hydroxy acid dehydrogenase YdfG
VSEVIVTGATGGIGQAVVAALVAAGHQVSAVGRAPDRLRSVPGVRAVTADLAQPLQLAQAIGEPGQLDALVVRVTTIYPGATATGHLRQVREAFGHGYDPQRCIQPETLAATVAWVLAAPPDAHVSELSVLAAPRS